MTDWKHELSREQYEMLIDSILRASTIASVIGEMADRIDPDTLKGMAEAMKQRTFESLAIGGFDEDDVKAIHTKVLASIRPRPNA
ncbi:MAG: hypothetical protein R3D43_11845 [Tepidamorphaceae bacterium]|nr:hypothetical protein [Rhodobiaceae bacterium]MCC0047948.1 hypothetical protein [Rhodobiaceae bacterium]